MLRNIQIGLLFLLALFFAAFLLFDLAYYFNGSLELFATDEQQGKVRGVALLLGIACAFSETAIVFLLWRLLRRKQAQSPRGEATVQRD